MQEAKKILRDIKSSFRDAAALMRGNLLVLTIGMSIFSSLWAIFAQYEGVYILALGGTYVAIGAFYGVYGLVGAMAGIPGGYICDAYGRRKIIVVGNYITALSWFFIALAPNWQTYFAAMVFLALAAFWIVAEDVILMDSIPVGKRGFGYGLFGTIIGLTSLASPYIGGWIFNVYHVQGMKVVLFSVAVADLTKAVLYTKRLKETLEPQKERKNLTPGLKNVFSLAARSFAETFSTLKWLPPPLMGLCALNIMYTFAWSLAGRFFIFYAMDVIFLTTVEWGLISAIQLGISLALRFPGGRLVDRYSRRRAILILLGADIPVFLGFIYSRTFLQVLAVLVLSTIVVTLTEPAWYVLRADLTPREKRGKVSSLFRIMGAFSGFFGSLIGGYLYTMRPALPFWVFVFFAVAGTSITFVIVHDPKKPEV